MKLRLHLYSMRSNSSQLRQLVRLSSLASVCPPAY